MDKYYKNGLLWVTLLSLASVPYLSSQIFHHEQGEGLIKNQSECFNHSNDRLIYLSKTLVHPKVLRAGATKSWIDKALETIENYEYLVTHISARPQATNRQQNFRSFFEPQGVTLHPRGLSQRNQHREHSKSSLINRNNKNVPLPSWKWKWETKEFGRRGLLHPISPAKPIINGNRVEYNRGPITEWYENRPEGLEQGFIIFQRPTISATTLSSTNLPNNEWVIIASHEIQDLKLRLSFDNKSIYFLDNNQNIVLEYGQLLVKDRNQHILPSKLGVENNRIILSFSDKNATYPIVIDPLLTAPSWARESNQAFAFFGCSVASAGDVNGDGFSDVLIGAYGFDNGESGEGRAFVYHGSASGLSSVPNWSAEVNQADAHFGWSVSSAGDVNGDGFSDVIIGAYKYDNGETDEGRVYVYHGSPSGLTVSPNWTAEGNESNAVFGYSLATAGDVNNDGYSDILIGFRNHVCVFHGSSTGLSNTPAWLYTNNQPDSNFGYSVAGAGDTNGDGFSDIIVGDHGFDNGETNEGSAYVFLGSPTGVTTTAFWTAESNQAEAWFGFSVACAGDVNGDGYSDVIIGAPYCDNPETSEGLAYVFHGSTSGLAPVASWVAENNLAFNFLGYSVSGAGDINGDGFGDVLVGIRGYDNGQSDEGQACVYHGSASGLATAPSWSAEGNLEYSSFANALSSAGDVNGDGYSDVIIGASTYDNGEADEGRAFVFNGSAVGLTPTAYWSNENNQPGSRLSTSAAYAGDLNGDGYSDLIVGAPYYDGVYNEAGRVYIFLGKYEGLSLTANQTIDGGIASALFGSCVSTAGDVNGDGFCDAIVGAPHFSNGESNEGIAYVFYGNATGLNASASWSFESNQIGAQYGSAVSSAGDVNGDGYADVLISSPFYNNLGRVYLFLGGASGLDSNPAWYAEGDQINAQFGSAISSCGDVNGDGFADIVIGAPFYDNGQTDEGRAFVYLGHSGGLSNLPVWTTESGQADAQYGRSVSSAGDVNGDGYSDVVISAPFYDNTQSNEGRVYVYHGNANGLIATPSFAVDSGQNNAQFGCSVASAGDINNDGYCDIIIGAYQLNNGRAYIFFGSTSGLNITANYFIDGDQSGSQFGYYVAGTGDANGDGYSDVIIGAPYYDNGQTDEGKTFLYYGNEGVATRQLPRQIRPSNNTAIGPSGLAAASIANTEFLVRLFSKGSQGRSRSKLQVQISSPSQPISTGIIYSQSSYTDTGVAGLDLNFIVGGLNPQKAYNWRARLLYDPSQNNNGQLHSPWYRLSWGSLNGNADFRTGPAAPATPTPTPIPTILPPEDFQGQLIDSKHFFVYPNPARGTNVKFKFFLKQAATVKIKIFTPQGKFVWEKVNEYPLGWSEITWNASGMANGVYFYIGEAKNSLYQDKITKKLGLVK